MQAPRLYSKRLLFTQYLVTARPEELVNFLNQRALQNVEHVVGCSCRPQSAFHDCWSAHVAPPYSRFGRFAVLNGDNRVNGQIDGMAMRQTQIATAGALVLAVLTIVGVTVINAKSSKQAVTAPASSSIDVMRMMHDAKDLPSEQFGAH